MSSDSDLYLVTGGSGFLGSNLVKALVDAGRKVRVLDNNFRGSHAKLGDYMGRVEFVEGDIRDRAVVDRAVKGVNVLCHLAFINGTRHFYEQPVLVLDVGVRGTMNVLESAIAHGVREFVYASSSEVYQTPSKVPTDESIPMMIPDPRNARYSYGGAKLIGEIMTFNYGRDKFERTVVFRPHNVYGPDMGFEHVVPELAIRLRRLANAQPKGVLDLVIQGEGNETRAFCEVRDFTRGLMAIVDKGADQNVYHIGTDEEVSIRQLAVAIGDELKREIRIVPSEVRAGGTPRRCPDIGKLRELGYAPALSLKDGLKASVEWYAAWADNNPS
jgi:nucleoside-diphosphate-sugar epimerase